MSIQSIFSALCEMLHAETGRDVHIGRPEGSSEGIYVWPWRLEDIIRPKIGLPTPGEALCTTVLRTRIYFLVFSFSDFTDLTQVHLALMNTPILNLDGQTIRIMTNPLTIEQLTSVFAAARMPLDLCLSFAVEG